MKRCGIIGGVGPSATVDLVQYIIKNTPAKKDQEHLRMIIDNNPQIPDRTAALLNNGESPNPFLIESINLLKQAKVDFIICPCNTAHVFLRELKKEIDFNFIDMIEETIKYLAANNIKKAGLLSTSGTAKTGIYQNTGKQHGIEIFIPSDKGIKKEMEAIYGNKGIKANPKYEKSKNNKDLFLDVINEFKNEGIKTVIMGCTEIPLCLETNDTTVQLINPTEILAKSAVDYALAEKEGIKHGAKSTF
ncbi:aspartate racemase [Candidatus Peregrinibacteria bacterium CG11_big_fil_rev_8_21_14_0_20_41_10]|nr:MAG: aspartate racemase [Candidatus Peregrinibacteria bacterium CG11_big_fil_rev_8_21_14_0_20_41_10]PIZ75543.1 MAG: aspartate racemase [Candidatus Peregrinibacteria bacterium CG_4_10_14_0_2_um_filter_41_8]PJC38352.1 MAG: aspartate racemase [Candidatus Peregrinibacteria bacterium CG_4_9_14_0_2_um_filter_41_14]